MSNSLARFFDHMTTFAHRFPYPGLSPDQQRRRGFLLLLVIVGLFLSLAETLIGISSTGVMSVETLIPLTVLAVTIGCLLAIRYLKEIQFLCNAVAIYAGFVLIYVLAVGATLGDTYVWFYAYPSIAYFLLGKRYGFMMVAVTWISSALIMGFDIGAHSYPPHLAIQFVISYTLVCTIIHGMEASRAYYNQRLQIELQAVEEAMQQVNALQKLLPICATCKKIRDDDGYWYQVETYMYDHAGIEFSHGICPDCRDNLYASYNADRSKMMDPIKT